MSDPKAMAATNAKRLRILGMLKSRGAMKSTEIAEITGYSRAMVHDYLNTLRRGGFARSKGRSSAAKWVFVTDAGATTTHMVTEIPQVRCTDEEIDARRREVLSHVRGHGPIRRRDMVEALGIKDGVLRVDLAYLMTQGCIENNKDRGFFEYQFVRSLATVPPKPSQASVQIVRNDKFLSPTSVIKRLPDGVLYTYKPAPRGRYEVDLPRGTGAISIDNPRLAALAVAA